MTKSNLLLTAAVAGLLTAGFATASSADDAGKCYGIAKAGKNSCASATGVHSCSGQAKVDNDAGDWVSLSADDCAKQGGKTMAPTK